MSANTNKTVESVSKSESVRESAAAYVKHFASASDATYALVESLPELARDNALFRRVRGHKWNGSQLVRADDSSYSAYYFAGFRFNVWRSANGWNSDAIPELLFDANGRDKRNADSRARTQADSEDKAIRYVMMRVCAIIANKLDAREIEFSEKDVSRVSVAQYNALAEKLAAYEKLHGTLDI